MKLAVLSGKGGTGKTTLSVNLAAVLDADYNDCDVEEPNGYLFLNPREIVSREVRTEFPVIDAEKCILCGKCAESCAFNALAKIKTEVLVFPELCHGCGLCGMVCPTGAVTYGKRTVGRIDEGEIFGGRRKARQGVLNIGEPMAVPVINSLLEKIPAEKQILDLSPGTACNVGAGISWADAAVMVTEPTTFGLHDLKRAVEVVSERKIPFGVVINKYSRESASPTEHYCMSRGIPILGRIPFRRRFAEIYSRGGFLAEDPEGREIFMKISERIREVLKWSW